MTESEKKSSKVVHLKTHHAERVREDIGDLLQSCRAIVLKRIGERFCKLFETADDALFDFGEKADTNSLQMRYFDDLRDLRRKRNVVERLFHQGVARSFSDFTTRRSKITGDDSAAKSPSDELSLLAEEELEETLAFTNMVNKAENRFPQELHALNRRFSVLAGGAPVEVENNPVGPARICSIFQSAAAEFDIDRESRLIVYKLFDRTVLSHVGALYDELNSTLIDAGVLPQIKTPIKRPQERGTRPQGAAIPGQAAAHTGAEPHAAAEDTEVVDAIRGLLASRHETDAKNRTQQYAYNPFDEEALSGGPRKVTAYYAHLDLINALAVLQGEIARTAKAMEPGAVAEIKRQLVRQVSKFSNSAQSQTMASDDEDVIDLIGMLFEFILTDRNLPDTIQALLARLQIPYLKIALMDKRFFADRRQPARRLLDEMARAGIGWTPENDKDQKLINKLRETVARILNEFDDDIDLFDELLNEFNYFLGKYRRMAEATERRTMEATQGRERLQIARRRAAQEILVRLERYQTPEAIRELLARPWANVMVLTYLRHGENSQAWAQALQLVDDLIWCSQPKAEEVDRMRMVELVYPVSEAIREGLMLVALHDDEIERILSGLTECFEAVLTEEPVKRDTVDSKDEALEAHAPEWVLELGKEAPAETSDSARPEPAVAAVNSERASYDAEAPGPGIDDIELGTWVEFAVADGAPQRAKLSWISPISHRYLFVNQKGIKIADKTRAELIEDLANDTLLVLDDVPIFDRAMDAIAEQLRQREADTEKAT